jgi:hypothetical protein
MKNLAIIVAIISVLGLAAPGFALEEMPLQDNMTQVSTPVSTSVPRTMRISERFGRSMANIFFSPLELPAQIYIRAKHQEDMSNNPFAVAGGLIEGIPMGALVYFPWRLWSGLIDLFTLGSPSFDTCFIEPEYLSFSPESLDKSPLPLDKNPKAGKK